MPQHDYKSVCGYIMRNQYRSVQEGGSAHPPTCPICGEIMQWIIPVPRMDLRTDGEGKSGERFQKFLARDGRNHLVEIDSTHKLREIERESEQLARNGEGQVVRFRAWEQDHSNMSTNVFGERPKDDPDMHLTAEGKRKFGLQHGAKLIDGSEAEPEYAYGPGVNDSNTSPLEDV